MPERQGQASTIAPGRPRVEGVAPPNLECRGLRIGYGSTPLLPPVDVQIAPGEAWALVGRNGSGKSTLLKTLLGELKPIYGSYCRREGARFAHVPQRGAHDLCVPARAWDLVEAGVDREWGFWRWGGRKHRVSRALEDVGASALADEPFSHLSEGQKQRVLMARALASRPDVLLLDEPTSAMDPIAEDETFRLIDALRRDHDLSVIVASHSMAVLPALATHILFVDRDDQVVIAGERSAVMEDERFRARYGRVLHDEASMVPQAASGSMPALPASDGDGP